MDTNDYFLKAVKEPAAAIMILDEKVSSLFFLMVRLFSD
jgi:hypothetical protein